MSDDRPGVLEVWCRITPEDHVAFFDQHNRGVWRGWLTWAAIYGIAYLGLAVYVGVTFILGEGGISAWFLVPATVLGFLGAVLPLLLFRLLRWDFGAKARRVLRRNPDGVAEIRVALTPEGVGYDDASGYGLRRWPWIRKVVATRDHVFIYLTAGNAFMVPRRDCTSDEEFSEFSATARRLQEQAKAGMAAAAARPRWARPGPEVAPPPADRPDAGPEQGVYRS
jgi:hypothetical protein